MLFCPCSLLLSNAYAQREYPYLANNCLLDTELICRTANEEARTEEVLTRHLALSLAEL